VELGLESSRTDKPCQKLLAEKVERKNKKFPVVFPHRFFYRVFDRFSARGAQKHHKNIF
jgi:hypothetical protein